jgi:hypothetical protein
MDLLSLRATAKTHQAGGHLYDVRGFTLVYAAHHRRRSAVSGVGVSGEDSQPQGDPPPITLGLFVCVPCAPDPPHLTQFRSNQSNYTYLVVRRSIPPDSSLTGDSRVVLSASAP